MMPRPLAQTLSPADAAMSTQRPSVRVVAAASGTAPTPISRSVPGSVLLCISGANDGGGAACGAGTGTLLGLYAAIADSGLLSVLGDAAVAGNGAL